MSQSPTSHTPTSPSPVAAILPAYNEAETIGPILKTLVSSQLFRDIIVVSDGSTDRTADIARASGASLVHQFPWKHGKGAALLHGVSHTDAPLLFFLDADLRGLTREHLTRILEPVRSGKLVMCVGIRDRGWLGTKLAALLPLIGGERVVHRTLFEKIPERYLQGYRVELAMNAYCRFHTLPYGSVELPGLTIRRKMQKVGFWKGLREYLWMGYELLVSFISVRIALRRRAFE